MRRGLLSALALLAVLACAAPSRAAAAPMIGVNVSGVPTAAQLDEAIAAGAKQVRMFVLWRDLEPQAKGRYDDYAIRVYADIVGRLASAGVRTEFVVTSSPSWASGSGDPHAPPRNPRDYADFLARFASTPGIAGRGVAYELWNEEDAAEWWMPAADAAAYAALVKTAAPALRAADGTAEVVLGPMTGNNYPWLEQLYDQGIQGYFDAVAVHTDTACLVNGPADFLRQDGRIAPYSFLGFREVRASMLARGDDKPIRVTEVGWSSTQPDKGDGPLCQRGAFAGRKPSGVTQRAQATFLSEAYHCLAQEPAVASASWFTMRDSSSGLDELRHYGLLTTSGARKPAWTAFRKIATDGDQLSGACGDFDGPRITVSRPRASQLFTASLRITASASDRGGPRRITFLADGRKIRNFTTSLRNDRSVTIDWQGAKRMGLGTHTIKVVAVDAQGNQSEASVEVRKVTPQELLAAAPVTVAVRSVRCDRRRVCAVRGRIAHPSGSPLPGKVQVQWSWRRKGGWKVVHGGLRNAARPATFRQRLRGPGRWRVRLRYVPPPPAAATASPWRAFRAR
jgi:hypothetical protein